MTIFLVNGSHATTAKRGSKKKMAKRGKLKGAAKRAFLRRMAAGRRKAAGGSTARKSSRKSGGAARKRTRRTSPSTRRVQAQGAPMAAKRKRRKAATSGTHRRRRTHHTKRRTTRRRRTSSGRSITLRRVTGRVYRTNGFNLGGIGRKVVSAAKKGAIVTGSRAIVNIISRFIPLGQTVPMRIAAQVLATAAVGFAGEKFISREVGELAMIGGFDALYTSLARNMSIPVVSAALGDDVIQGYYLGDGSDVGSYYDTGRSTLPAGSSLNSGIGDAGDDSEAALLMQ